jgi:hypothetical protein
MAACIPASNMSISTEALDLKVSLSAEFLARARCRCRQFTRFECRTGQSARWRVHCRHGFQGARNRRSGALLPPGGFGLAARIASCGTKSAHGGWLALRDRS